MMADVNTVLLSTQSFAQIKNENCKYRLLVDNLLSNASLSADHQRLEFDSYAVASAIQFVFTDDYKKRLATARKQASRYGSASVECNISDDTDAREA